LATNILHEEQTICRTRSNSQVKIMSGEAAAQEPTPEMQFTDGSEHIIGPAVEAKTPDLSTKDKANPAGSSAEPQGCGCGGAGADAKSGKANAKEPTPELQWSDGSEKIVPPVEATTPDLKTGE
jgi:hypothetical protein